MHGLYIDSDNNIKQFTLHLLEFALKVDFSKYQSQPYLKYKNESPNDICFVFSLDDIKRYVSIRTLSFLRTDPPFEFCIAFTQADRPANATHKYKTNRITLICPIQDFNCLEESVRDHIETAKKSIIGTICHELVHAFDYSKTPKRQLDKNKASVYKDAKVKLEIPTQYIKCHDLDWKEVIKDVNKIYYCYYTVIYYTQQTELNAYLRTFQNQIENYNAFPEIDHIEIYRRFKFFYDIFSHSELYPNKSELVSLLKNSSWPTCYGKVNNILNNSQLTDDEKLRKINFIINHNYIEYEINRFQKLYCDMKNGYLKENAIMKFNEFLSAINK